MFWFSMISRPKVCPSKENKPLETGLCCFKILAPYLVGSRFWSCLSNQKHQSFGLISNTDTTNNSKNIGTDFNAESPETIKDPSYTVVTRDRNYESAWISSLRRFECSLQDIPESERSIRVCRQAIKNNPRDFYYVPDSVKSHSLCALAMKKEPKMLLFLPLHLQSKALYRNAVRMEGQLLSNVPIAYRCEDLYLAAVQNNGLSIEYIPHLDVTAKIARVAVRSNGEALRYVPVQLITKSLCDEAIRCEPFGAALPFVPAAYRTERMIIRVLKAIPMALRYIPNSEQTELARLTAVSGDGMAIQFIDMNQQSDDVCNKALMSNIDCFRYVSHSYRPSTHIISVTLKRNAKYPKDIQDAGAKLIDRKCALSRWMAKTYLSRLEPEYVALRVGTSIRRIEALAEIFDGRTLAAIFHDNYKYRAVLFRRSLGL